MMDLLACEKAATRGPTKGQTAKGLLAGRNRHLRAGEPVCSECAEAFKAHLRARHAANKDVANAKRQANYRANLNREKTYRAAYRQANRDTDLARKKAWHRANRDAANLRRRTAYEANVEREKAARRSHYQANRDARLAAATAYYEANTELVKARVKAWARNNPDKVRSFLLRRRAREAASLVIEFTVEQLAARLDFYGGRCWICDVVLDAIHIDHVKPLAVGGYSVLANYRPCCISCNSRKGSKWFGPKWAQGLRAVRRRRSLP